MDLKSPFTEHPASVGESYTEHMEMAGGFGIRMLAGGAACLVHAILPFLFVKTGSSIIAGLHDRMVVHRDRRPAARERPADLIPAHHASE